VWALRLVIVLFLAIGVLMLLLSRWDAQLQQSMATLDVDDPGWRLDDLEAKRAIIPDDENSARVVVAAAELLSGEAMPADFIQSFTDLPPQQALSPEQYARLCNELNEYPDAYAVAVKLADMPRGRHRLEIKRPNVFHTRLTDQQRTRAVAQLLVYNARRRACENQLPEAMRDCRAALNCGRSLGDEPFLISMLIRTAAVTVGCEAAQGVLAQGEPPLDQLEALQRLLEDEDKFPDLFTGIRGERASIHEMCEGFASGILTIKDLDNGKPPPGEALLNLILRPEYKSEHPDILSLMTRYLEASKLPLHEQPPVMQALNDEVRSQRGSWSSILTRQLIPAVGNVASSSQRKHAFVRCMICCLAAERYRRAHDAWPPSLDALVPSHLAAVPLDPYDGAPLRYKQLPDGVVIYSVGYDMVDDDGKLATGADMMKPGWDLGYRLWNVAARRQKAAE
jgi:hypothetical protein